jgi:bifunctional non-homologous end joining protein LigD
MPMTSSTKVKYDGFPAIADIKDGHCSLVSRNGNTFKLCTRITERYGSPSAILDGQIVCMDGDGRPMFDDLFRRRGQPCFAAFDLLYLVGHRSPAAAQPRERRAGRARV